MQKTPLNQTYPCMRFLQDFALINYLVCTHHTIFVNAALQVYGFFHEMVVVLFPRGIGDSPSVPTKSVSTLLKFECI
jgi:hypothetical protein